MKDIAKVLCRIGFAATIALVAIGCDDNGDPLTPPPGGAASSLTASNSIPADGNGTITVTGTYALNFNNSGYDELNLSETGHDVTILWDTNTHVLHTVQHGWGTGFTQCAAGTADLCDTSRVVLDFVGQEVTFTNLVLADAFGGASTSTLNGTARW